MTRRSSRTSSVEALEVRAYFAFTLGSPSIIPAGPGPSEFVATSDFNKDGNADVAVVNSSVNNADLDLLLGTGDGTFGAAQGSATGDSARGIVIADFNNDTFPDVATALNLEGHLAILLNNGSGGLSPATKVQFKPTPDPVGSFFVTRLAAADFNGDGKQDLIATAVTQTNTNPLTPSTYSLLLGNGDGTFQPYQEQAFNPQGDQLALESEAVAAGDLNGDSKADLILSVGNRPKVSPLLGNGDGTFMTGPTIELNGPLPGGVSGIVLTDVNADTKLDIVAATSGDVVSVALGNGDGTFQASQSFPSGLGTNNVAVADFDSDGKLDIAATTNSGGTGGQGSVSLLAGNGDGTFQAGQEFNVTGSPSTVAAADLNADGKPDLIVGPSVASGGFYVLLNGAGHGGNGGGGNGGGGGTPAITPTLNATLPAAVVGGARVKGAKVSVNVANTGDADLNQDVTVNLFASSDTTLDDADTPITTLTKKLKLKPNASKAIKLKVAQLPNVADGDYYLIARTTAASIADATSASSTTVNIAAPFVDLSGTFAATFPATGKLGKNLSVPLTIQNSGNVSAAGTIDVAIASSLTQGPPPVDAQTITVPAKLKLKAGASRTFRLRLPIPAELPTGSYFLSAQIDSTNVLAETDEANNQVNSTASVAIS